MSSQSSDENNNDLLLHSFMSDSNQYDSGYLTFTSPSRLSPSNVVFNQFDSPISEHDIQSPINLVTRNFLSTIDYEHYITTRKYFDILTQLYHRNAYHLIDEILKTLSNTDLNHCLSVCKNWNMILKDSYRRKQTKNVKRNLFNINNKISSIRDKKLTSTPMQTITNTMYSNSSILFNDKITNIEENRSSSTDNSIHLAASKLTFRYGYLKYLHGPTVPKRCPLCAFVSIVDVNDQHG